MKLLLTALALTLSFTASADFVLRDWKVPGDNLVIRDTDSQLEWLKLSVTGLNEIKWSVQNVWRRTQETVIPGYEFLDYDLQGWRIANKEEIDNLFSHAFPTLIADTVRFDINHPSPTPIEETHYQSFVEKFGIDIISRGAFGIYCESTPTLSNHNFTNLGCRQFGAFLSSVYGPGWPNRADLSQLSNATWLVRGIQVDDDNNQCPIINTELTRQQAIELIQHLSSQLTDPNSTLITNLSF